MHNKENKKCQTTGIGSLPFTDPHEAVAFVLSSGLDIPFWPQLPQRCAGEKMIPQYADRMPCVKWNDEGTDVLADTSGKYSELEVFYSKLLSEDISYFALNPEHAAGFYAFMEALKSTAPHTKLKGQITGPMTFTTGISTSGGQTLYSDPELRDAAVKMLARNACWQVGELLDAGAEEVIIFIDEPVMSAYGSSAYIGISEEDVIGMLSEICSSVASAGALSATHVCGNSDWSVAMRSGVDILNFDAYQYGHTLGLYKEDLEDFIGRGGCIAWGLVPTSSDINREQTDGLSKRFHKILSDLESKGLPVSKITQQSLFTPSCGAGSLSIEDTKKVFSILDELKNSCAKS